MSHRTDFTRIPLRVSSSDAPYGVSVTFSLQSYSGPKRHADDMFQSIHATATAMVERRDVAEEFVAELRALADDIESYIPNLRG